MDYLALWVWLKYYLNITAITAIIFFILAIGYQRSKRVIINTAERPYKPDNSVIKLILKIAIVAIVWFAAMEYGWGEYIKDFFNWTSHWIGRVWNG